MTLGLPELTGTGVRFSLVSPNRKGAKRCWGTQHSSQPPSPASVAPADVIPTGTPGPSQQGELLPFFPSPTQSPPQGPLAVTAYSLLRPTNESYYCFLVFEV